MINKKIARLQKLALKAAIARNKFEEALEKAKQKRDWVPICAAEGIYPGADPCDWMC